MKILMASHYFSSHKGGIEIVAEELFHALSDKGQEVVWMASDTTPPPQPTGRSSTVSLHAFNFVEDKIGLPFPIPRISAMKTIIREIRNADVLILHDCLYLSNILAFIAARWRGIPAVIIQHIGYIPYKNCLLNSGIRLANTFITRPMLSRAAQVVFISETTRNFFGRLRFRNSPEVIFNGVNTDVFHKLEESETKSEIRREYHLPEDGAVILFVGRFVEKKGISVMKHMVEMRPEWAWVFAGWGPLDPAQWNAANVRVFSDLRGASMAALYRACDLLVLPSSGEGFPLVMQEALASGIPVVCGEETLAADPAMSAFVRGAPVFLREDGKTARAFLTALDEALASGVELNDKSKERRAFAVSRYSWQRAAEQYIEILSRLVPRIASKES
jgi:glycosyltransferase involved in cell wall biosynthesis